MDRKITNGVAKTLIFVALVCTSLGAANATTPQESTGDYRDFTFSAERPYFFQDGKVDFGTYNGFRRYHSECHVCHGPAGLGSSYAPSLLRSLETLSFHQFVDVIVRGFSSRENFVMPGFAENLNVLPYLHDLYAYLKARADHVIGPDRPKKFPKVRKAQ